MQRKIIITQDGSSSISMEEWGESYHSVYGAVQEAKHVYLQNGLDRLKGKQNISILEMGFGTGLNTFLTYLQSKQDKQNITYHSIEAFPLNQKEVEVLNYTDLSEDISDKQAFDYLHQGPWLQEYMVSDHFKLLKMHNTFEDQELAPEFYDLIYFDAFGYPYQPELWSQDIFEKMYLCIKPGGVLATYACRGVIKRNMQGAGFTVKTYPGPPGKREIIVAFK